MAHYNRLLARQAGTEGIHAIPRTFDGILLVELLDCLQRHRLWLAIWSQVHLPRRTPMSNRCDTQPFRRTTSTPEMLREGHAKCTVTGELTGAPIEAVLANFPTEVSGEQVTELSGGG